MKTRLLGDIEVSEIGMGCMAFSHGYGKIPEDALARFLAGVYMAYLQKYFKNILT